MGMIETIWIVTTTVGSIKQAEDLAQSSVQSGLVACAQVDSPITSHYIWKDQLEYATEYRITFKLSEKDKDPLISWLRKTHPFDCPQILAWKAESGNPEYTKWIEQS